MSPRISWFCYPQLFFWDPLPPTYVRTSYMYAFWGSLFFVLIRLYFYSLILSWLNQLSLYIVLDQFAYQFWFLVTLLHYCISIHLKHPPPLIHSVTFCWQKQMLVGPKIPFLPFLYLFSNPFWEKNILALFVETKSGTSGVDGPKKYCLKGKYFHFSSHHDQIEA